MRCPICRFGETQAGKITETLTSGNVVVVVRNVPAEVCDSCGEGYTDEPTSRRLRALIDEALGTGGAVQVREYSAA